MNQTTYPIPNISASIILEIWESNNQFIKLNKNFRNKPKKTYLISGFSGTRPGRFFLRRLSKPLDSFSGKGGISSRTVAKTSRVATLDKAKYSQALCCNSASALLKFESVLNMSSMTVFISGNRLINLT